VTAAVKVFVSYAHEDSARAEQLIQALTQAGLEVWWDKLIVAGNEFASTTEQALEAATAVVVLWSQASVSSHWVRDEATRGRDRGCLVPVSLDGVEPPIGFRQYLVISLAGWRGNADADEIRALAHAAQTAQTQALQSRPGAARALAARAGATDVLRRRLLLGGGGLAAVALGAGWLGWQRLHGTARNVDANSVAVLPFANISGNADENYFSDGLSAEVRAALAHNPQLRVMAQISSEAFRSSAANATTIAGKLGVAYLLDGNVRRSGNTLRIAAELIDGLTGFNLWSQIFDRPIGDVFAVQSEIAGLVLAALNNQMRRAGQGAAQPLANSALPGGTANVAAFDAYLRGRADYNLFAGEASDRRALAEFESALAADPKFAAAHAARSRALIVIANQYEDSAHTAATYDAAILAARTATELAPDLADAQSTLGFALFQGRLDVRGARQPYQRSYELGAGDATVLGRYALYCALTGRADEAHDAMSRAVALDPLNPLVHRAQGSVLYAARRYQESLAPLQRALALNPNLANAQSAIGRALLQLGRVPEARAAFTREPHKLVRETGLAIAEQKLGNKAPAAQALDQLRNDLGDSALYQQAEVAAQWGERELALKLLTRARSLGDSGLIYLHTDPLLDPLRGLPAFDALRRQLGFE